VFFDIGTFAEGEVRQWHVTSICSFLESELRFSYLGLEVFVKFPKIDSIFLSAVGGQILLRVNCEVRMISFVSKEREHTSSLTRHIVVGELSQRKQLGSVVLLVVAVGMEVLFEGLIDLLGLTIPFRIIS